MRVFLAGGTGIVGKHLVPLLVKNGHEVVALVRSAHKAKTVEDQGAKVAYADALNKEELTAAIRRAEPEAIINQLTALGGVSNFKKFDEEFALTNRLRTEVTDTMLAAARITGTRRFIAQIFCGWPFAREGVPVKTEEDPQRLFEEGTISSIRRLVHFGSPGDRVTESTPIRQKGRWSRSACRVILPEVGYARRGSGCAYQLSSGIAAC
jgi:NAD(P)H-binding